MNIQAIIITNLIGITLTIITALNSEPFFKKGNKVTYMFQVMLFIVAICCLSEMCSFIIDGKLFTGSIALNFFFNTILYIFNTIFSLSWILFIDYQLFHDKNRLISKYSPFIITGAILIILVFLNIFFPFLFKIDSQNVYSRTIFSYIFLVYPFISTLYSLIVVRRFVKKRHGLDYFPIYSFLIPFFIAVIAQSMFYGVSLAWCGTAIGMTSLYMSLQNKLVFEDSLTNLHNRYYLNNILESPIWKSGKNHSGIMIDVDYFKDINDTYGHFEGDKALVSLARTITESIPESAIPIRYAGDEFIILLFTSTKEEAEKIKNKIQQNIDKTNEKNKGSYQLSVSMGDIIYSAETDTPDTFFENLDKAMYENKVKNHEQNAINAEGN